MYGRRLVLVSLALLYMAQGVPFGLAAEYLPVVLSEANYSMTAIALFGWAQLPWQLKVLVAPAADAPALRARQGRILLGVQLLLALSMVLYAVRPIERGWLFWFLLTAATATFAAVQDVFVDALAVRTLAPSERGHGNVAQVAGYRLGMLAGGAGLLLLVGPLGVRAPFVLAGGFVALAGAGARIARRGGGTEPSSDPAKPAVRATVQGLLRHLVHRETWPVLALAFSFKVGIHMASAIVKPFVVHEGWTKREIGGAIVVVGTVSSLVGAAAGGVVHRRVHEPGALFVSGAFQAAACLLLVPVALLGAPRTWTIVAFATEHFASGVGTTVLFAALMSATRKADAGFHYTVLTSANALSIGAGGLLGALIAQTIGHRTGAATTFAVAVLASVAPLVLVRRWAAAVRASSATAAR